MINYKENFINTQLAPLAYGKSWHLSYLQPTMEEAIFTQETQTIMYEGQEHVVTIEFAVIRIERPWFEKEIFDLGLFSQNISECISDGKGKGLFGKINTHMILTKSILIDGEVVSDKLELLAWIVQFFEKIPK